MRIADPRARPIVVIDDDEDIRDSLADLLTQEGYQVRCFANGAEALDGLHRDADASLILLDLRMPIMNGWRFRTEQCLDHRLAAIPVIVMSTSSDIEHPPAPPTGTPLSKPLDIEKLLARIAISARPVAA